MMSFLTEETPGKTQMPKLRLGIIGCGAVTEKSYLPAVIACNGFEVTALVDKNITRAENLANTFSVPHVSRDYTNVFSQVDAAIVALPHYLHAPVSIDLLNRGVHVLVEKPMALSMAECQAMVSAAEATGATLAVGLVRRFLHSHQFARRLISGGFLGRIESFDVREGSIYRWPVASDFFFRKEAGGGVLADTGAHTLDTLLWWLGDYESVEYFDDNMGGVEANCELHLRMRNGAEGVVELSRTRNLRNTAIIRGEKATLEVQMLGPQVSIQPQGSDIELSGNAIDMQRAGMGRNKPTTNLMRTQLEDWLDAIQRKREPWISGREGAKSVALIEACHESQQSLAMPWLTPRPSIGAYGRALHGKKVLVTGGTGFIGGYLVEHLVVDCKADVSVLVRNFASASRIARFPIQMVQGDITDLTAVGKVMEGCEIVFHCAYGNTGSPAQKREVNIKGTENVLKAALEHKVKRLVHVSTISVYGQTEDGALDETAPGKKSGDAYADSKLEAEKLAFGYFKRYGLPVAVIQPTIVYGPFAPSWTIGPIKQLMAGRFILVEGGSGFCNAVYVDDVVQALLLAATKDEAVGEAFLISGEAPVTWHDFYGAYEKMLDVKSTVSMSMHEIIDLQRRYKKEHSTIGQLKTAAREHPEVLSGILRLPAVTRAYHLARVLTTASWQSRLKSALIGDSSNRHHQLSSEEKPIIPLTGDQIHFFRARTHVRIDKAKRMLGYQPTFDFESGATRIDKWLKDGNLPRG